VLTECCLREADFYVSPTRPDYLSSRGLKFLREFRQRDPHMAFAESLGVVINMKDAHAPGDIEYEIRLRQDGEHLCFRQALMRASPLQAAARFTSPQRSYWAKYPGQTGESLRQLTAELLARLAGAQASR
jgi:chromosome partitioning protein